MKKNKVQILFLLCMIGFQSFSFSQENKQQFDNGDVLISYIGTYHGGNFTKSKKPYSNYLLGVYYDDNPDKKPDPRYYKIPIKTSGITYVKYNNENGLIKSGDPVTSSSTSGVAMKATQSGMIIGIALEDATNANGLVKIKILIQYLR